MFKKKPLGLFCKTCQIKPGDSVEEMERKLYPKFCIGHVALFGTGLFFVIMELFVK